MHCWVWILVALFVAILATWFFMYTTTPQGGVGRRFGANLSGDQEVPPVSTAATGSGSVILANNQQYLDYNFEVRGLSSQVIGAHFHLGERGVNGPVVKDLNIENLGNGNYRLRGRWSRQDINQPLTSDLVTALLNSRLYVNVHTNQYPDGEVRGQVVPLLA